MANTPKKIKDPTEAALSAIQDALSARDAVEASARDAAEAQAASPPAAQVTPAEEPTSEPTWRAVPSATPDEESRQPEEPRQPEEQSLPRRAANDDRESIGQILRTLQRRPAHTSYVTATVFAVVWVLAGLGVVFFVPIIFFYVLAHMAWRSQELRLITQSMAEVAMRLAEPETVARESIVTVGQAIRREVAA